MSFNAFFVPARRLSRRLHASLTGAALATALMASGCTLPSQLGSIPDAFSAPQADTDEITLAAPARQTPPAPDQPSPAPTAVAEIVADAGLRDAGLMQAEPTARAASPANGFKHPAIPEASAYGSEQAIPEASAYGSEKAGYTSADPAAGQTMPASWGSRLGARAAARQAPVSCGHPNSGCGCGGHGNQAYFTSGPWNQYGIDPQEFLCDGGDQPPAARLRRDDTLMGIGLEDTVVKYKTERGQEEIQPSNRVCIYAPRFGAVRQVAGAVIDERTVAASGIDLPQGPIGIDRNQPSSAVTAQHSPERNKTARSPDAFRDRDRGVPVEGVTQPIMADEYLAALVDLSLISRGMLREADKPWLSKGAAAAVRWSHDTEVAVAIGDVHPVTQERHAAAEGLTVYDFPDAGRLRICKLADKQNALPGEIVTFLLRVDNVGDSAVSEIVITDNLTTRLEYVEGSQTCSVGAIFETEENNGRSLQLTWKLTDELKVGEGANIRFQCRVR